MTAADEVIARRRGVVIQLLLAAGAAVALALWEPRPDSPLRCLFQTATGLHCPGCGALRGGHLILRGQVVEGWWQNPLLFTLAPGLLVAWLVGLGRQWRGLPRPTPPPAWLVWLLVVLILLFWVLRNLPGPPFRLLAPT